MRQDGVATSLDTAFHRFRSQMANHPITWQHLNVFRYVGSHEVVEVHDLLKFKLSLRKEKKGE